MKLSNLEFNMNRFDFGAHWVSEALICYNWCYEWDSSFAKLPIEF